MRSRSHRSSARHVDQRGQSEDVPSPSWPRSSAPTFAPPEPVTAQAPSPPAEIAMTPLLSPATSTGPSASSFHRRVHRSRSAPAFDAACASGCTRVPRPSAINVTPLASPTPGRASSCPSAVRRRLVVPVVTPAFDAGPRQSARVSEAVGDRHGLLRRRSPFGSTRPAAAASAEEAGCNPRAAEAHARAGLCLRSRST